MSQSKLKNAEYKIRKSFIEPPREMYLQYINDFNPKPTKKKKRTKFKTIQKLEEEGGTTANCKRQFTCKLTPQLFQFEESGEESDRSGRQIIEIEQANSQEHPSIQGKFRSGQAVEEDKFQFQKSSSGKEHQQIQERGEMKPVEPVQADHFYQVGEIEIEDSLSFVTSQLPLNCSLTLNAVVDNQVTIIFMESNNTLLLFIKKVEGSFLFRLDPFSESRSVIATFDCASLLLTVLGRPQLQLHSSGVRNLKEDVEEDSRLQPGDELRLAEEGGRVSLSSRSSRQLLFRCEPEQDGRLKFQAIGNLSVLQAASVFLYIKMKRHI